MQKIDVYCAEVRLMYAHIEPVHRERTTKQPVPYPDPYFPTVCFGPLQGPLTLGFARYKLGPGKKFNDGQDNL